MLDLKIEETEDLVQKNVRKALKKQHEEGNYDIAQSSLEFEKVIQKLEAEVRNHISVQQQLKIYIECYQQKVEDAEKAQKKHKNIVKGLDKQLEDKSSQVSKLEQAISEMKQKHNQQIDEQKR